MDPYRLYFPLGLVFGAAGTLLWVFFGFGAFTSYPGAVHADLMVGGFLLSFATGFLMTAVPRFTGAASARNFELVTGLLLQASLLVLASLGNRTAFHVLSFLSLAFLVSFAAQRFLARNYDPPPFFVFVGLGLASGLAGSLGMALTDAGTISGGAAALLRILYYQGTMLCLVLGVGGQLLPAFFGWKDFSKVILTTKQPALRLTEVKRVALLAVTLFVSFVLEGLVHVESGRILRALLVSFVAFTAWRLHKRPSNRGYLTFWLWMSAWFLVIGNWIYAVFPDYSIHGIHLVFVGGFSQMTLMIASRVILSHGGYDLILEQKTRAIAWAGALLSLAAIARVSVGITQASYLHHLAYAAAVWIVGAGIWAFFFFPRMLTFGNKKKST